MTCSAIQGNNVEEGNIEIKEEDIIVEGPKLSIFWKSFVGDWYSEMRANAFD
jgi:hypothetical protein